MLKEIWSSDRFWGIIGKVSILIAILGGLVAIFPWLVQPENRPKLLTFVAASKFEYPTGIEEALENIRESQSTRAISVALSGETSSKLELTEWQVFRISHALDKYFHKAWAEDFRYYRLPQYSGYAHFGIMNDSEIEADNVVIDLPSARGVAQIVSEGTAIKTSKFSEAIQIGLIRPKKFVGVKVWSETEIEDYREQQIQVTHKTGLSQIRFRRETYGILGAFKEHLGILWFPAAQALLVALFLVLFGSFKLGQRSGRKKYIGILEKVAVCPALPDDCPERMESPTKK